MRNMMTNCDIRDVPARSKLVGYYGCYIRHFVREIQKFLAEQNTKLTSKIVYSIDHNPMT